MSDKLGIHTVLNNIDNFNLEFFDSLTTDQKKKLSPYVLMLWMNGCTSELQVLMLNGIVNELIFNYPTGHNELMYKLLLVASDGVPKRYDWFRKKNNAKGYATCVKLLKKKYKCNTRTALEYVKLVDYDYIAEIAMDYGEQDDTLKQIKKELA